MSLSRMRLVIALAGAGAALTFGVIVVGLSGGDRPLDRVSLIGTAWQVASIDGSPTLTDKRPTLRFDANNKAVLETPCRLIDLGFSVDTDGAAITFGENGVRERPCTAAETAQDQMLRAALAHATAWRVKTSDSIELFAEEGGTVLGLDRTTVPVT